MQWFVSTCSSRFYIVMTYHAYHVSSWHLSLNHLHIMTFQAVEVRTRDPVENTSAHRWSAWHGAAARPPLFPWVRIVWNQNGQKFETRKPHLADLAPFSIFFQHQITRSLIDQPCSSLFCWGCCGRWLQCVFEWSSWASTCCSQTQRSRSSPGRWQSSEVKPFRIHF